MTLQELQNKVINGNINYNDFKEYDQKLSQEIMEFRKILEEAYELDRQNREFEYLLRKYAIRNSSDLIDRLKNLGYAIRKSKNKNIKDSFSNMGYRLLEQARAGKREEVFYGFLRIFISGKENFPLDLIEAFKNHYSDEMFKVFIFSFLSGIIGQDELTKNEE